ncbi:MAG: HEAT repeat domain-containing protein [Planctomycetes bacterium]|nr:HEAT repeat domain-containing protein [Planctomycetota bacterium]
MSIRARLLLSMVCVCASGAPGVEAQVENLIEEPTPGEWVQGLSAERPEERRAAIRALARLDPPDRDVVQALRSALHDSEAEVRALAAQALAGLGGAAQEAVADLLDALGDPDAEVQAAVATCLGEIGRPAQAAVPALAQALRAPHEFVRAEAARALLHFGRAGLKALMAAQQDPNPEVRFAAGGALSLVGPSRVDELLGVEEDARLGGTPGRRRGARASSAPEVYLTADQVSACVRRLQDPDVEVRVTAATELAQNRLFEPNPAAEKPAPGRLTSLPALPALIQVLADPDARVRERAARAVAEIGAAEGWGRTAPPKAGSTAQTAGAALLALLRDPDPAVRKTSLQGVIRIHHDCPEAAPALIAALSDADAALRSWAIAVLGRSPYAEALVVAALLQVATTGTPEDRAAAIEAIGSLGNQGSTRGGVSAETVDRLLPFLQDETPAVRDAAVSALANLRPTVPGVLPALLGRARGRGGNDLLWAAPDLRRFGAVGAAALEEALGRRDLAPESRMAAAYAVLRITPQSTAGRAAVLAALRERQAGLRRAAATALDWLELDGEEIESGLLTALEDLDVYVRRTCALALARLDPTADQAAPILIGWLRVPWMERQHTASALIEMGASAVPHLVSALSGREERLRAEIATILGRIGRFAQPAVNALRAALADPEAGLRAEAALALGRIGTPARAACAELRRCALEKELEVRLNARFALALLGEGAPGAVDLLIQELKVSPEEDRGLRAFSGLGTGDRPDHACRLLAELGAPAAPAVPALIALLRHEFPQTRDAAREALGAIEAPARAAVPELLLMAKSEDEQDAEGAIVTLGRIGPDARAAVPTLVVTLTDPSGWVRISAALALWRIEGKAGSMMTTLIAGAQDPQMGTQHRALEAIGEIGQAAVEAVPALIGLLENLALRSTHATVVWALGRIGPGARAAIPALREAVLKGDRRVRIAAVRALMRIQRP